MSERFIFNALIIGWFILAAAVFIFLFFVAAPYGRHIRAGWGRSLDNRLGWILMEAPAPLAFAICFLLGDYHRSAPALIFLLLWEGHYLYRSFVFPLRLRGKDKRMPIVIAAAGFFFNAINGYLNGRYLFTLSGGYPTRWLREPLFLLGLVLFVAGFYINYQADATLRSLRRPDEAGYKIPQGGLYRWVSCPNYLGEIIEWLGWAVATLSPGGLAFAVWVIANLAPRARTHHRWYQEQFPDYPPERRALLPILW